jgi:hypothetical protein
VLGYNPQRQRDLLASLGLREPDWRSMTAILSILSGVVLLVLTVWILRNRQRVDPALTAWRRFTARMARLGIVWQAWEGPLQFAERAARLTPQHARDIVEIAALYAGLRYGPNPRPDDLSRLKSRIASFRP